jgi:hypothetical protein
MVKVFLNDVDISRSVTEGSIRIDEAVDRQGGTASFTMEGTAPTEGHELVIFDGCALTAAVAVGTTVPLPVDDVFADSEKFRVGDVLTLGVGETTAEEVIVTSVNAASITVASVVRAHAAGTMLGKRLFGGIVSSYSTKETPQNTTWVSYDVSCTDYRAVLNRKLVNNVWTEEAPHVIVQDILDTVNGNAVTIDLMEYASDAAIQTVYNGLNYDADAPTRSATSPKEGTAYSLFPFTYSAGRAEWTTSTLSSCDLSTITGVSSGTPTRGVVTFWARMSSAVITSGWFALGNDWSNYSVYQLPFITTDWTFYTIDLTRPHGTVGTVNWTAIDTLSFTVNVTASGALHVDALRAEDSFLLTANHVDTTGADVGRFAVSFKPAAEAIDRLAKQIGWTWWVDSTRDVHFHPVSATTVTAPFSITETSANHEGFSASPDVSQLANRVYVRGGKEKSASQTEEQYGDGLKTVFFTKESPRSIGPYLYDVAIFVDTGAGYNGKTYGIANRDDPASYEFLLNAEEGYITNGTHAVLGATDKLKVVYTYLKPVLIRQDNVASQAAMQAFQPGTDGIFEHVIIDSNITSSSVARSYAASHLASYGNAVVTVTFTTSQEGLQAGQTITIDKPSHGISSTYLIQRISRTQVYGSTWLFSVTCASTVLGIVELFALLLERDTYTDENTSVDVQKSASETITVADVGTASKTSTKFRWKTASPAGEGTVWNRFSWA